MLTVPERKKAVFLKFAGGGVRSQCGLLPLQTRGSSVINKRIAVTASPACGGCGEKQPQGDKAGWGEPGGRQLPLLLLIRGPSLASTPAPLGRLLFPAVGGEEIFQRNFVPEPPPAPRAGGRVAGRVPLA